MKTQADNIVAPVVDFTAQFCLADKSEEIENEIFNSLKKIAGKISDGSESSAGAIVVLGDFSNAKKVNGLVQMKPKENPITCLIKVGTEEGINTILTYSKEPFDGAVIVDKSGQIIGAGIYLVVEHPLLELPEKCGTRHKAAASFSLRDDVISVLTLSEETNTIRIWKDGSAEVQLEIKKRGINYEQDSIK
jgi:DNA integrity scanning protein DisA with diadenylate cyclase activity